MATFDVSGIDEAVKALNLAADQIKKLAPAAALAGGQAAAELLSGAAPVRTGQLSGSMKIDGPHTSVANGTYVDVYPDGRRADGERNATVGYVLEYGRSNMPARPWMRPTLEGGSDAIGAAMAAVLGGGS